MEPVRNLAARSGRSRQAATGRAGLLAAALPALVFPALFLLATISAATTACASSPAAHAVALHPSLPDTLTAAQAARFGLFAEVEGLRRLWFLPAPWGGYLVRLEIAGPRGLVVRERSVPSAYWRRLQERVAEVLAGGPVVTRQPLDPAPAWADSMLYDRRAVTEAPTDRGAASVAAPSAVDTTSVGADSTAVSPRTRARVWPEVPLPPRGPRDPVAAAATLYPDFHGRWLTFLEAGYRQNTTSFGEFFTGMAQFGLAFGRTIGERAIPYASFTVGFGDIRHSFEEIAGDGRSNIYNFALGILGRQPLSQRTACYLGIESGYFVRTLQWGGVFVDPYTGAATDGFVLEQQDWGAALRIGVTLQRPHAERLRIWDIGLSYQVTPADRWDFYGNGRRFVGDGRDAWLAISIRFWDTL